MLKEMIVEKSRKYSSVLLPFGAFLCSVIAACSTAGLVTAPLICALAGALSPLCSAAVFAGGIITYLSMGMVTESGFEICALILITVGKWLMRDDNTSRTSAFVTFLSMAFSGIVFGLVVTGTPTQAAVNLLSSAVSAAAAYFIREAAIIASAPESLCTDRKTLTAAAVVYTCAVSVLSGMSISVINPGAVAACALTLCACRFFGCYGGVICGVLSSAGIFAGNQDLGLQTAFFGVAGLAAGFASGCSRITITAVFSGVNLLGQLASGMNDASFCIQADAVLGGVIFLLLPERIVMAGGKICAGAMTDSSEFAGKEMEFAAKSLSDIRNNVMEVMTALENRKKTIGAVDRVSGRVCSKCRSRLDCWEKNYEFTNSAFRKIRDCNGKTVFPAGFDCVKKDEITAEFERCRGEEAIGKMLAARLNENRGFLFSQMKASEDIVRSLSMKMNVSVSKSMTATLCRTLERYGVEFNSAIAYYNADKRLIAEIYVNKNDESLSEDLCEILSRELSVNLECSQPFACSGETRLRFNQRTKFGMFCASRQLSASENSPSGDSCGYFTDGLGYGYLFISDGMGSGSSAAIDSEIASRLFKRLICSGMDCDGAVKMINSVMLAKSGEESFATLDIARINLETGELTLCKSGAAATLIKYDDAVMMFSLSSNPLGIIADPKLCTKECAFGEGNVLVMMSDGVPENAYPYIKEQLGLDITLDQLAENVCSYSRKISPEKFPDDISVMVFKLEKNM